MDIFGLSPRGFSDRLILVILSGLPPEKVARAYGVPVAEITEAVAEVRRT